MDFILKSAPSLPPDFVPKWPLKNGLGCSDVVIVCHKFEKQKFRIKKSCVNANN